MRIGMPLLALVVAILLVASQSLYTVDQRKYAVKLQLGEFVDTLEHACGHGLTAALSRECS